MHCSQRNVRATFEPLTLPLVRNQTIVYLTFAVATVLPRAKQFQFNPRHGRTDLSQTFGNMLAALDLHPVLADKGVEMSAVGSGHLPLLSLLSSEGNGYRNRVWAGQIAKSLR